MRTTIHAGVLALALASTTTFAQPTSSPEGHWEGTISMPEAAVKLSVDLVKNDRGVWLGAATIVGSSAVDVPLDSITISDTVAKFHVGMVESPTFSGTFSMDGMTLSGDVANARGAVPFQLKKTGPGKVNVPPPSTLFVDAKVVEGAWAGEIKVGERVLHLLLTISAAADGSTAAKFVTVEQGNLSVPITTVTYKDKTLRFESRAITSSFAGTLGADGAISGEWTQGTQKIPVVFKRPVS